jgi:hypothetical protein
VRSPHRRKRIVVELSIGVIQEKNKAMVHSVVASTAQGTQGDCGELGILEDNHASRVAITRQQPEPQHKGEIASPPPTLNSRVWPALHSGRTAQCPSKTHVP